MEKAIQLDKDKKIIFFKQYVSIFDKFNEICLTKEDVETVLALFLEHNNSGRKLESPITDLDENHEKIRNSKTKISGLI